MSSSFIPMPVSLIDIRSSTLFGSSSIRLKPIEKVTTPFSVYLTELVSIFVMTYLIRISSPCSNLGVFLSNSNAKARPLSSALI